MRLFALSGYRLGGAPREVRLVYTGFLGFTLVGLVISMPSLWALYS